MKHSLKKPPLRSVEEIIEVALTKIKPSESERRRVEDILGCILSSVKAAIDEIGINAEVEVEGSFAKDTWISGDADVDIFILFPKSVKIEDLKAYGLQIGIRAARALGASYTLKYAEHPYVELVYEGLRADIVPAYIVEEGEQIITAVDRTPLHTRYVKRRLTPEMRDSVRLLKAFLRGIGAYGAEIKVEGFSGYLAELLVIYYGSFTAVVKAASSEWRPYKTIIDVEGRFPREALRGLLKKFNSPLVVIDPVDPRRNVAAALSLQKMAEFIAACKGFLRSPSLAYFFPPQPTVTRSSVEELLKRCTAIVAIKFAIREEKPEDVVWGQLKRASTKLARFLERMGFDVYSVSAWYGNCEAIVLLELDRYEIPSTYLHVGPPVFVENAEDFLLKNLEREDVVAGPYVIGDRWCVIRRRSYVHVRDLILRHADQIGLSRPMLESLKTEQCVYTGANVINASSSYEYLKHLYDWLVRKPAWLREG